MSTTHGEACKSRRSRRYGDGYYTWAIKQLREEREKQSINQQEMARKLGRSPSYLSRLENGDSATRLYDDMIERYLRELDPAPASSNLSPSDFPVVRDRVSELRKQLNTRKQNRAGLASPFEFVQPPGEESSTYAQETQKSLGSREEYLRLCDGLEWAKGGWHKYNFTESQVVILVTGRFQLPKSISRAIYWPRYQEWKESDRKDNPKIGVCGVRVPLNDKAENRLRIDVWDYDYFEFLATNRAYHDGNPEEQALLKRFVSVDDLGYRRPVPEFANALSVGLTMFCENGRCLVITRRATDLASASGWEGRKIFNAVGENMESEDIQGTVTHGARQLSPFTTARRGLYEEMGWREDTGDFDIAELQLHSFAFDHRILHYKFFGYVVSPLTRADVEERWERAPDRSETHKKPLYNSSATKEDCLETVRSIREAPNEWSKEAIFSTLRSLEIFKGIPFSEMCACLVGYSK